MKNNDEISLGDKKLSGVFIKDNDNNDIVLALMKDENPNRYISMLFEDGFLCLEREDGSVVKTNLLEEESSLVFSTLNDSIFIALYDDSGLVEQYSMILPSHISSPSRKVC